MSRPKEKTIFTWIMFALTIWSIFLSLSELVYLGWKTIKHIYKKNVSITVFGEEISPKKHFRFIFQFKKYICINIFRIATIASALYSMNRDFGIEFYSDSYNQDLRLNLPIETCLLQFIQTWIITFY